MSAGLLELARTVKVWFSLRAPEVMPLRLTVCTPASSLIVRSKRTPSINTSLTELTVTMKVQLTVLL